MRLKEYLMHNNMTIARLSVLCDCSPQHISGYMAGRYRISKRLARYIAQATDFKVSIEELWAANPKSRLLTTKKVEDPRQELDKSFNV